MPAPMPPPFDARDDQPSSPAVPVDALSLFPEEASINAARDLGEPSIRPRPAETVESTTARPPSVSIPPVATPLGADGRSDEAAAPAGEWISPEPIDAPRVRVAAISEDVARVARTVLALEARISRLTAKDQLLAVSMENAPELERRSEEIAAQLQESARAAEDQTADIAKRLREADDLGEWLSGLKTQIDKLGAPDQALARGEADMRALEGRAATIVAQIEQITAQLERAASAADASKQDIAARLAQVGQIGDRLSTLQAAIAELIEPDRPLTVGEARAERLERRGAEISTGLERTATIAERQATDIANRLREADALGERLSALETHIATLGAPEQALARGEADMRALEGRAATTVVQVEHITAQLEGAASAADASKRDIAARLAEVGQIGDRLSTLQAAIGELIEPDQPLAVGEARAERLERRGAEISTGLERTATIADRLATDIANRLREADALGERLSALETHIATLGAPEQALARGETDMRALEGRAATTVVQVEQITAQLELAATAADASKRDIAARLLAVNEIDQQLSTLETRISTAHDRQLAALAVGLQQLEQRSADILAQSQRASAVSDAQSTDIAQRVAQAADIGDRVSTLETRMSKLIGRGQLLDRAEGAAEQLEHRLRNAVDELERARQTQDYREREIARLHEQLTHLIESVPKDTSIVGTRASRSRRREVTLGIVAGITSVALAGVLALRSPQITSSERSGAANRASIAAPVALLPATPLPAGVGGIRLPPSASPPRMKVLAERWIASTEPRVAPEPVPAQKPLSRSGPSSAVRIINAPTASPVFFGALDIASDPAGSTVFIDGKLVGETPLQVTALRAGSHVVRIVRDGHRRWTASVPVPADKRTRIKATLEPESR
jgi:chromosome segregation ATPase